MVAEVLLEFAWGLGKKGFAAAQGAAQGWLAGWRWAHLSPEERARQTLERLTQERLLWEAQRSGR
jgi:hypothetical protein